MKKYLTISLVLGSIALICAAILAALNLLTKPVIDDYSVTKQNETLMAIYEDYDANKSLVTYDVSNGDSEKSDEIIKIIEVKNSSNEVLGYVYTVTGKNQYGTISLMVAISPSNVVHQIEFLENGQSFASTVASWAKQTFVNKGAERYEGGFNSDVTPGTELTKEELDNVDVKCTATYGATTVRNLVQIALADREAA